MTREEAVKICTREKDCVQGALDACADGGHYVSPDGIITAFDYVEAMSIAIAALREQEERSKGCEWCAKDRVLCWDSGGEEVCIVVQGKLPVLGTDDWGFAIKFCPMCGRRLEEV